MTRPLFPIAAAALCLPILIGGCKHSTPPPAAAVSDAAKADATPTVSAVTVAKGTIERRLPVTGTLAVLRDRQGLVTSAVASTIDQLLIHPGQKVTQGEVIAQLSTRTLLGQIQQALSTIAQNQVVVQQAQVNVLTQQAQSRSAVLQAESAVSGAQANLAGAQATLEGAQATLTGNEAAVKNAEQNLARAQRLFKDGLVAQKDVEAAQLALRTAQAQVDAQKQTINAQMQTVDAQRQTVAGLQTAVRAAEAAGLQTEVKRKDVQIAQQQVKNARGALATAQAQMALYTIRAPLSGLVTNVGVSVGETVDTTKQIATIANLDTLQMQIAVPSASASQVHTGQTFTFRVDSLPNQTFSGQIRSVGVQVDPANSTVTALALVPNAAGLFKDSMSARVWIVTDRRTNTLLAPKSAVFFSADGKASVVIIGADNVAHTQDVKTGLSDDNNVEILTGVSPGARLATTGGYGLPDGTKVVVSAGDSAAAAANP
ncbi:MAG: efflux transporter, family, subunit [Chthonomonadaceae bacterium]|nr:efflux transporter, family, subunit [Chthonomonadaceae bacterium]